MWYNKKPDTAKAIKNMVEVNVIRRNYNNDEKNDNTNEMGANKMIKVKETWTI